MPDIEITEECRALLAVESPLRRDRAALAKRQLADAGRCQNVGAAAEAAPARRVNLGLHYPPHHHRRVQARLAIETATLL
jgi:hypothetical protein